MQYAWRKRFRDLQQSNRESSSHETNRSQCHLIKPVQSDRLELAFCLLVNRQRARCRIVFTFQSAQAGITFYDFAEQSRAEQYS
jgi:hypothetical protein